MTEKQITVEQISEVKHLHKLNIHIPDNVIDVDKYINSHIQSLLKANKAGLLNQNPRFNINHYRLLRTSWCDDNAKRRVFTTVK